MTGYYVKTSETECSDLVELARVRGTLGIDDELSILIADEDRCMDIDKAWHGIHVMLCGLDSESDSDSDGEDDGDDDDDGDDNYDDDDVDESGQPPCKAAEDRGDAGLGKALRDVVLGGTPLDRIEMAYLPVRWLGREEVANSAAAIADIDLLARAEDFRERILGNAAVYPGLEEEDDINYLDYNFEQLKRFFREAAEARQCMLLFID